MKTFLKQWFYLNWQRKLVALILAIVVWILVNHAITVTIALHHIPIKVIHLPPGKTIEGLRPDSTLDRDLTLHITGSKRVLDHITSSDLAVLVNAANKGNEWIVTIRKNELVSLNPSIDLFRNITSVSHENFIIKLSNLITEEIPVFISQPIGSPPDGFQFLDIWPRKIFFKVRGPEDEVKKLKLKGLKLTFNLNEISQRTLNELYNEQKNHLHDEISFRIPQAWLKVHQPSLKEKNIEILSSKDTEVLRIDFIKQHLIPLDTYLPIEVFYPLRLSREINPLNFYLLPNTTIKEINGISVLNLALYAHSVSHQFLDTIRDNLQITITATPNKNRQLPWSLEFINFKYLEDRYVNTMLSDPTDPKLNPLSPSSREEYLRHRFQRYIQTFQLFIAPNKPLKMRIELKNNEIILLPEIDNS